MCDCDFMAKGKAILWLKVNDFLSTTSPNYNEHDSSLRKLGINIKFGINDREISSFFYYRSRILGSQV